MVDRLEKAAYNKNRGGIQRRMLNGLATHDASPFKKLAKGTYDARNTGGLKTLSKSIKTDFGKGVKDSFKAMTDKKEKREKELDKKQKDALQKERESQSSEYRQKESEKKNAKDNTENAKTEKRSADNRESNAERKVEKTNKKQNTNSHAIEQKEKSIEAIKKGRLKSSNVGDVSKATMKQNQNLISEIKEEINDKLSKLERVSGTGFGGNPNKKEEVRKLNEQLQNLDELGTLYTEKQELAERANTEKQELADAKAEVENANTELENAITIESDTKEAMKDIQDDWMKAVEKLNTIKETPPLSAEEKSLLKNEFDVVFDDDNNIVRTASTEKLTKMNDEERKAHRDLIKKHNDHIAAVHKEIGGLALTPGQRKKKNLQRKIQDKIANSKDFDKLAESIGADTLAEASKIKQGKKSSKGTDVKNTSS
jgi:myosin heavy subunit